MTAGCDNPLAVTNNNNPDVTRAYSTPAGIEQLIATSFQQVNQIQRGPTVGSLAANDNINSQLLVMSLESYGTVANFGMAVRTSIPRAPVSNARGNQVFAGNLRDFSGLQKQARQNALSIAALDELVKGGKTLGSPAQNARARAFAWLVLGIAEGDVGLVYDSASVITPASSVNETAPLVGYKDVIAATLAALDSAILIANSPAATSDAKNFTTTDWIRGNTIDGPQLIKIARSYKARYRAGAARTPAERAAVDWTQVIADATNGITADLNINLSNSAGWSNFWLPTAYTYQGWHNMSPMYYGMADTSGGYDAWLATPLNSRSAFLIRTPDKRFPSGDTRAEQQTASGSLPTGTLYFRNRPTGDDTPADPWGVSPYDNYRFRGLVLNNSDRAGPWPTMTKAEIDLLAAEGYIRKGDYASAASLIDKTRTKNGLPSVAGITSATQTVPGGNACVPRVPNSSGTSASCGTIMEAMKWEKRVETAFTGYGQWYFDSRGWGDLVEGTALQFPVPYQEMDSRLHPFYNMGGIGDAFGAKKGTYGF
jgi:hypothetical protein